MTTELNTFAAAMAETLRHVAPVVGMILIFQLLVIRRPLPNPTRLMAGFFYVILGITLFLEGLEMALFPLGELMAKQLTAPEFTGAQDPEGTGWDSYFWVYAFAAATGFATTMAEPALIAVAIKATEISAGAINPWGLRLAVAGGAAAGLAIGTFRIVTGGDLSWYILTGYLIVLIQTVFAPKMIIGLAYDSGGVTTSTVTVPVVTALGLGLASTIPGRNPLLDGFGLIAFTCLFPIIAVLAYAQVAQWWTRRAPRDEHLNEG